MSQPERDEGKVLIWIEDDTLTEQEKEALYGYREGIAGPQK